VSANTVTAGVVMETFQLSWPRPLRRLFGRNLLLRGIDRIEALILVLAVAFSVVAAPFAAATGTAVYDSRRQVYAEQADNRHSVSATVVEAKATRDGQPKPGPNRQLPRDTGTVQARWFAAGTEHTGTVTAPSTAETGDSIEIWVDHSGKHVGTPQATSRAAVEAVSAAVAVWFSVAAAAAVLFAGTRALCDRFRIIGWQRDIDRVRQSHS
jgi:hypothetical protein